MDKIIKFLKKLSKKEQQRVLKIIKQLERNDLKNLHIKKLSGEQNIYRVRVGDIRIIFLHLKNESRIISIERRSDTTYHL